MLFSLGIHHGFPDVLNVVVVITRAFTGNTIFIYGSRHCLVVLEDNVNFASLIPGRCVPSRTNRQRSCHNDNFDGDLLQREHAEETSREHSSSRRRRFDTRGTTSKTAARIEADTERKPKSTGWSLIFKIFSLEIRN